MSSGVNLPFKERVGLNSVAHSYKFFKNKLVEGGLS